MAYVVGVVRPVTSLTLRGVWSVESSGCVFGRFSTLEMVRFKVVLASPGEHGTASRPVYFSSSRVSARSGPCSAPRSDHEGRRVGRRSARETRSVRSPGRRTNTRRDTRHPRPRYSNCNSYFSEGAAPARRLFCTARHNAQSQSALNQCHSILRDSPVAARTTIALARLSTARPALGSKGTCV